MPPARGAVVAAPAGLAGAATVGFGAGVAWAAASGAGPTATEAARRAVAASGMASKDDRRRMGSPLLALSDAGRRAPDMALRAMLPLSCLADHGDWHLPCRHPLRPARRSGRRTHQRMPRSAMMASDHL